MKKITFSVEESPIDQARLVAQSRHKTLNAAFCEWLERYASQAGDAVDALMSRLQHVKSSGPYTRGEIGKR